MSDAVPRDPRERVQPHGDDDGSNSATKLGCLPWEEAVRLPEIRRRFEIRTAARGLRSQHRYWREFERFAESTSLERLTRAELQRKGGDLLIGYLGKVSEGARSTVASQVKKVWRKGLELEWPLDKDDLPQAGTPEIIPGPRRGDVEPWVHAARTEQDPYERSWFMFECTYGLRPEDQQAALLRRHIVFAEGTGKPLGIVAHGREARMKKPVYVIAAFPLEVADAMEVHLSAHPDANPDARIWPFRGAEGRVDPSRPMKKDAIYDMRRRFRKRHGPRLKHLTPTAFRKFVKGVLVDDAGMPEPLKSYWQGHKPKRSDMDHVYGTKPWDEIFTRQLHYIPDGPMGLFGEVKPAEDIPPELAVLWRQLKAKQIDAMDMATAAKALLRGQEVSRATP